MDGYIERLAKKCAAVREAGDYEHNGLLHCGKCHAPKECRVSMGETLRVMGCFCECGNKRYEAERERRRREEEQLKADRLRLTGIADKGLRNCRFENARDSAVIEKCRRYAERWKEVRSENVGMLLWGDTGGGKTYAAACVANTLIDRGHPVLVTSFPRILAAGFDEREELLQKTGRFSLLVLDDLGAERGTEMALETVYAVIDERYKSRKPLIVTTNLPLREIQEAKDLAHKRIYDRVLEVCTPVLVQKAAYRRDEASRKMRLAKEIFGGTCEN